MRDAALFALSPTDGRYRRYTAPLQPIASEYGLIRYRVEVMGRYVCALNDWLADRTLNCIRGLPAATVMAIIERFSEEDAQMIKAIETRGWNDIPATNHDVKACEIWLRIRFAEAGLGEYIEMIHFGCTSEDVNNIAYGLMIRDMVGVLMPKLNQVRNLVRRMAEENASVPMLSRTHGQPATPTTLGKELAVFVGRLDREIRQLSGFEFTLKLNGASGSHAALKVAYPSIIWPPFSAMFIERVLVGNDYITFRDNPLTTQIEPHDVYARLFDLYKRINTILVDFCQDIWRYISDEWLVQIPVAGEVGSSTMPHKVNPINFENGEGNLQIANWIMEGCCRKLPISRLQRDLSDSTVERMFGVIFGHMLVAYENIATELRKITPNRVAIEDALNAHPEVLTEAYMTVLRRARYPGAYDVVKNIARGKRLTLEDLHAFVDSLDDTLVTEGTKMYLKSLRPARYFGEAEWLVENASH